METGRTVGGDAEAELRQALEQAELPPLLPAVAFLTGDLSVLREDLRPGPAAGLLPQGGLDEQQRCEVREVAARALLRHGLSHPPATLTREQLLEIVEFAVGGEHDMSSYLGMIDQELGLSGRDVRAPLWTTEELRTAELRVVVIGAGMSGLLAAHRLRQAGAWVEILEKSDDVGGTWVDNTYPGCRVDNPSLNYSYSFEQRTTWSGPYATQRELAEYFRGCALAWGLMDHIRFDAEVLSATWSEDDAQWRLVVRHDGGETTTSADVVVSAVGQLNRPSYPAIEGRDQFAGPSFHSARWDHGVDLGGQTVAIIGTGASALQFAPRVVETASEVRVFQRTPPWLVPTPNYQSSLPDGLRWLYDHLPFYAQWHRLWILWSMGDDALSRVVVDPEWRSDAPSVSATNDALRRGLDGYLRERFADRPDLLTAVRPDYPPGAKRMVRDDGSWPTMLQRPNVSLVTDTIAKIVDDGIVATSGVHYTADVLIYGTGFTASDFLVPMKVRGRNGIELHDQWSEQPRAYLGVAMPNFPNFFCLYGPNTNIVVNSSTIFMSECSVHYVVGLLEVMMRNNAVAIEVRAQVHDEFNDAVDAANAEMAWGASSVNSWYKGANGKITQNWPFSMLEYWTRTSSVDESEYVLTKGGR